MIRKSPLEDVVAIDSCGSSDRSSTLVSGIFVEDTGTGQQIHHALYIRVSAHVRLSIGDSKVTGGPSHPVAHKINGPLENVLTTVQQML